MKYVAMFLILLSIAGCISNKSSSINAAIGVPEMLINGEFDQKSLIGVATVKKKPTVPASMDDVEYDYNTPTKPSVSGECVSGQDC